MRRRADSCRPDSMGPVPSQAMPGLIGRDGELASLLATLRRMQAAVITGEAGAGKTVLLREVVRRCHRFGWTVLEVDPSPATSELALWPLHPLLPTGVLDDPADLPGALRDRHDDGSPTLVAVDDAQHLDVESIDLLARLCQAPDWNLVATVRDGAPTAAALGGLWEMTGATTVPVGPFDLADTGHLAEWILGGPVTSELTEWLAAASQGNALFIRELLLDAGDRGDLVVTDRGWAPATPGGPPSGGRRTTRCIDRRIGRAGDEARRLLELLAVADDVRVDQLPSGCDDDLAGLVERRLVRRTVTDGAPRASVDHPLVAETVLASMDEARHWSTTWALVGLFAAAPLGPGDASRLATWATRVGHPLDPDAWVAAAGEAIAGFDLDHARTWAEAGITADSTHHGAHRTLGHVLRLQGDLPAAVAALADAAATATAEADIAAVALDRAALHGFQRGEPDRAMRILLAAVDQVDDPARAMSLRSEAAVFGTLLGRFDDVMLVTAADPEAKSRANAVTRWTLGLNEVYALAMTGRIDGIDGLVDAVGADGPDIADARPHEMDLLLAVRGAARIQQGALARGITELDDALARQRETEQFRGIAAAVLALLLDLADDDRATVAAAEAVAQHEWMDPFGSTPIAAAVASLIASRQGRHTDAVHHIAAFADDTFDSSPWTAIWVGRARARCVFDAGDPTGAIDRCVQAGEVALDTGHRSYAAITLHDAVRYGEAGADAVAGRLTEAVAATSGAPMLDLLARHAAGVADADADGLVACARDFVAFGAPGLAGEAHLQRARLLAATGAMVAARRADLSGRLLSQAAARVGRFAPIDDAVTDRELEVARLAAAGRTSPQIAEEVFLSRRTVDNHLAAVYRKLDLHQRAELAALIG